MPNFIIDNVLHIEYSKETDIPTYIVDLADKYEGKIKNRIGFNLPMDFVKKENVKKYKEYSELNIKYIIVYKKGDVLTKKHELQHAKYGMNQAFRNDVRKFWRSLSEKSKSNVLAMLKKMNYPDNEDILIDEFQAYYFTEKKGFFGKLS